MGSVDCLKEIASSLDLFFRGLTDCGLLKTYNVQFLQRSMPDIASRLKFKTVAHEFLRNMQKSLQNSLDDEELLNPVLIELPELDELIPDLDKLVGNEMLYIMPENITIVPQSSNVCEEKSSISPNGYVETTESIQVTDKSDNIIEEPEPLKEVLRMMYSNKEKSDITEPWQVSILGNEAVDTTIDTITEVMAKNHMRDEKWRCDMCDKIFPKMHTLQNHCREEHNGTGCFECNLCGARVMSKLSLKRHIRSHSGINSNRCDICHKTFKRADYLATHYKLHQGVRIHKCSTCLKEFTSKTGLQLHERVHSDQKDYICHQCNKQFGRRDKLRDHVLRHLNIKRFECSVCKKRYAEKRDLRTHLKVHE